MTTIYTGDCLESLRTLPSDSVHCCVTSPPYWGLRDYGCAGQIGLESTVQEFIAKLVAVFREVRRVLRADGTCWVNMGDCYATGAGKVGSCPGGGAQGDRWAGAITQPNRLPQPGLKPKDLVGQPWRLAFALQEDGWYLRQDIIWHKPSPMPESVRDRFTKAHEYLFLLTKLERYFWNFQAAQEPTSGNAHARAARHPNGWANGSDTKHSAIEHNVPGVNPKAAGKNSRINVDRDPAHQTEATIRAKQNRSFSAAVTQTVSTRNRRSVWTIAAEPCKEAHFATFPTALVRPCILIGCPLDGTVLDPFGGSGTTAVVANELGRQAILCELNPEYVAIARARLQSTTPGLPLA